jgi:hypothetical protein
LLTPTDVRRLLDEHGLAPRKAAGQNFVVDPNTVRRIVAASGIGADDVVLEIGPGLGSLTLGLAERARRVVAVEIDAGLVAAIGAVVADLEHVEVVHADALRTDLGSLVAGGPARLVANLPYNVATPLVVHALEDPAVSARSAPGGGRSIAISKSAPRRPRASRHRRSAQLRQGRRTVQMRRASLSRVSLNPGRVARPSDASGAEAQYRDGPLAAHAG